MAHGYGLRPNAKGRKVQQSTDIPHGETEDTYSSSANNTSQADVIVTTGSHQKGESSAADPGPATSHTPPSAHSISAHLQDQRQRLKDCHSRGPGGGTSSLTTSAGHRVARSSESESWEDIQAARRREEARRHAEAARIQREQLERGYKEDMRGLQARIVLLRHECEVEVARVRQEWERAGAIERSEVVDEDDDAMTEDYDSDSTMEVDPDYASTEASETADDDEDDEQGPSRSPPHRSSSNVTHTLE